MRKALADLVQRRTVLGALASGLATVGARAQTQPASKMPRIGYLTHASAEQAARLFGALKEGLRALGYVDKEGKVQDAGYGTLAYLGRPDPERAAVFFFFPRVLTGS